jgi:hypothetical protein
VGVGICAAVCALRLAIRFICFRRFFVEDSLMIAAMAFLIALAVVLQVFLGDLYELIHVQNMLKAPGLDFPGKMARGLKGDAIAIVLNIIGLWLIKLNFMLLFYRLGYKIRSYLILWWIALVLVVACGVVNIGLIPYDCMLGSMTHITLECAKESRVNNIYTVYIASVVVDVLSDIIGTHLRLLELALLAVTNSNESYLFSHTHCVEHEIELAPKVRAFGHLFACGVHDCCDHRSREHLRRCLQVGEEIRPPSHRLSMDALLVVH